MNQFNIPFTAQRLTAYAIERQNGIERHQLEGTPPWSEQRRFWTDAILQGMARLNGFEPDPQLMEQYDQRLKDAHSCAAVETLPVKEQAALIRELSRYVSALEATGDDRRRQVAAVGELLDDMATHLSWGLTENGLSQAREQAERGLLRMTAQMPIRFTHILLGGDAGPHWASGFVSGCVKDAEEVRQTAVYQEAVRQHPEVAGWPALCTVYVGRGLPSALGTVDACEFDLKIMNEAGDRFLNERGIRWVGGPYQMTIPAAPAMSVSLETQAGMNPLLVGSRPLEPDDLDNFELYSTEVENCLTFGLDVLADEKTVFGRQLSSEQDESYIQTYVNYNEATGQVDSTLDVVLCLPHDEQCFHCELSPEVRESLKQKIDAFCVERYGEHLPEPPTQDGPAPPMSAPAM